MNKNSISWCMYFFLHWISEHLVSRNPPTHRSPNVVRTNYWMLPKGHTIKHVKRVVGNTLYLWQKARKALTGKATKHLRKKDLARTLAGNCPT